MIEHIKEELQFFLSHLEVKSKDTQAELKTVQKKLLNAEIPSNVKSIGEIGFFIFKLINTDPDLLQNKNNYEQMITFLEKLGLKPNVSPKIPRRTR